MEIAKTGDASKIFGHRGEEGPTLSKTERVGHPGVASALRVRHAPSFY
jgi:hypothetical protein